MSGVNKVILLGRLGNDPVVNQSKDGKKIANISLATSENWKDKDGNKQENTEWHKVVFFNRLAEIVEQYLKKGSNVYIEGKNKTRKWQDKEGVDRYNTEVIADSLQMIGGASESKQNEKEDSHDKLKSNGYVQEAFDDEIPF